MRTDRRPRLIRSRLSGQRGVTVIETVVALTLFALSAATMSDFIVAQIRASNTNTNYTIAYELAVKELEDVRALLFDQIDSRSDAQQVGGMTFSLVTEVQAGVPAPNMKHIDVTVTWNEPGGARNVSLETVYTAVTR